MPLTPEESAKFQSLGYIDDNNLLIFDTLHDMQVRATRVFEKRELFGTYSQSLKDFEWMTFGTFGERVDRTRGVLKDLGTL